MLRNDIASIAIQGLEVIEAHYLFGADYDDIDIVVHPQSIIHSMVETQVYLIITAEKFFPIKPCLKELLFDYRLE